MAINFKSVAQSVTTLSDLMNGRTQLTTEDISGKTLTVIKFDIATVNNKPFPVVVFAEHPDKYYNGGIVLNKICYQWAEDYEGDIAQASADLEEFGGVKFRFKTTKTKDGQRNLTTIEVVE